MQVQLLKNGPLVGVGSIFAFGIVAFGFLCMGPVNIAVDSYGPVTDNLTSNTSPKSSLAACGSPCSMADRSLVTSVME
jgi:hypothetical protein